MVLISVSSSSRWVAKLCRSACSVTFFLIPAASAVSWNRRLNWRVVIGLPGLRPGNNQRSSSGTPVSVGRTFHHCRNRSSILGDSITTILAALGLLDANNPLRLVDMLDLQPNHFAGTQAAPIAKTECHAGLEARGNGQHATRLPGSSPEEPSGARGCDRSRRQ